MAKLKRETDDVPSEIIGVLDLSFKSSSDGISWTITDAIHDEHDTFLLEEDDHLIVYNMDGDIIWEGNVHYDLKQNSHPCIVENKKTTKQEVFGYWVKWLQKDEKPESWAKMFFDHSQAKLIKKQNSSITRILKSLKSLF